MKTRTQLTLKNLLNIRRIALQNRLSEDTDTYIEKCYRHYSKTYHTPLHLVKEQLTVEEVALVFMEDQIEEWSVEDLNSLKEKLDESERPVLQGALSNDPEDEVIDDELWIAQQNKLVREQEAAVKAKQNQDVVKKTHEAIEQLTKSFENFNDAVKKDK